MSEEQAAYTSGNMVQQNLDFHEIWWIYSPAKDEWGGLRIAHFRKTLNGYEVVIIQGEIDQRRLGVRIWDDIKDRERWVKVEQIKVPTKAAILAAALFSDALDQQSTTENGNG